METAENTAEIPSRLKSTCSRVSNGTSLFSKEVDGRTFWAKRFRDLCALHSSDLGGDAQLSEAQKSLIRRGAALSAECESLEGRMAAGTVTIEELDLYNRLSGNLRRILESIGLERRARPVNALSLDDIKRHIASQASEAVE